MQKLIPQPQCRILGPVAILIQFMLGMIVVSSLLIKRKYEHPRRPWKVWVYDVSKQVFGALGIHALNLFVALIRSKKFLFFIAAGDNNDGDDENECDWYFLNLLMDTTIGVPILWACLIVVYKACEVMDIRGIESGNYGEPPQFSNYFKQLVIFSIAVLIMKFIIYLLQDFPIFIIIADNILSWSDGWPNFQIVLVMLVFPTLLNCFQYYVIDNIIKFPGGNGLLK